MNVSFLFSLYLGNRKGILNILLQFFRLTDRWQIADCCRLSLYETSKIWEYHMLPRIMGNTPQGVKQWLIHLLKCLVVHAWKKTSQILGNSEGKHIFKILSHHPGMNYTVFMSTPVSTCSRIWIHWCQQHTHWSQTLALPMTSAKQSRKWDCFHVVFSHLSENVH